ncbi:cysteine-rich CWC family protein [Pseudorhodoferax sp.]|uniref:cysteine-rich CWC family protein n=1 Tax=Pseudorhodoferax sp. TaxID=1993553 RepID=UPI002DD6A9B3|nr:cysteine-rich CWC family protein [Pseudorhodoferax sp.]
MPAAPLPPPPVPDAGRCPLCGEPSACVMAACGDAALAADCWCMRTRIAPEVLARVPEASRGLACVCARCAQG